MIASQILPYLLWTGGINLLVWGIAAVYLFTKVKIPIYHPVSIYLAYHFVGFISRPFAVYLANWSFIWARIGFSADPEDLVIATCVTNLAIVGCMIGILIALGRRNEVPMIAPTQFVVRSRLRFAFVVVLLLGLGMYSTYRGFGAAGLDSVSGFQTSFDDAGGQQLQGISGYTLALAEALPILCMVLLLARVPRSLAYSVTALFVLLRVYIGAQRLSFVVVLAVALFSVLIARRRRFPTISVVLAIVCGATLFDFVGHDRLAFRKVLAGEAGPSELWTSYVEDRSSNDSKAMDVVEYETAAAAIHVVRDLSGYSYGTQYLRMFIWPIPRQVWHDKPVYTSTVNLMNYGYNFRNLTYSLYADLYMAFGFPAVFFGMMLLGWAMISVYDMACLTTKPFGFAFFWIFLIYLQTILRDGGATFIYFWGFSSIFALILIVGGSLQLSRTRIPMRVRLPRPTPRIRRSNNKSVRTGLSL